MMPTQKIAAERPRRNWIAVASAEHVRHGREHGFMQVCHGKAAPLRRLQPGDRVTYYSPSEIFRGKDKLQAFTAAGIVLPREPYSFEMGGGFCPFRRDMRWFEHRHDAPIRGLLPHLEFAAAAPNWGAKFRFGLFEVSAADMDTVLGALGVGAGGGVGVGSGVSASAEAADQALA